MMLILMFDIHERERERERENEKSYCESITVSYPYRATFNDS